MFMRIISNMKENFTALEKYNFWNGNIPELGFPRKNYTELKKAKLLFTGTYIENNIKSQVILSDYLY